MDHIRHPDGHSKIVGICFDGYPIYGPYSYCISGNIHSGTMLMTSSYVLRDQPFTGRPYSYSGFGRVIGSIARTIGNSLPVGPGAFLNDYYYQAGSGTLDEYNGRFGPTPEYPNGTYGYYMTINEEEEPVFPYIFGNYTKQQRVSVQPRP